VKSRIANDKAEIALRDALWRREAVEKENIAQDAIRRHRIQLEIE
jgi:hypothetical protein